MARGALSIIVAIFVAGAVIVPVAAVLWRGGGIVALSAADWAALRFTVWQAFWSAAVSVVLAVPVARRWPGGRFGGVLP